MLARQFTNLFMNRAVTTPLGRWRTHNNNQTALKVKYANEDHCGTCGDKEELDVDDLYVYMMGLESVPDSKIREKK